MCYDHNCSTRTLNWENSFSCTCKITFLLHFKKSETQCAGMGLNSTSYESLLQV